MPRIELEAGHLTISYDWRKTEVMSTGVLISRFPSEGEDNDEVLIVGTAAQLNELAEAIAYLADEVADG